MQERQISNERKNTDMQTGLYADKQGEPNENKVAYKQDDNLSNDIENKQSFNLPDLGLSSALGLLTPDANKEEEQIPEKENKEEAEARIQAIINHRYMNEYEEMRKEIDIYLMKRFKYRLSLVRLTPDNILITRRNSRLDLYLRIRRVESIFPPDCLILAQISFRKERIGNGTHFVRFLSEIALKYGFRYVGIESTNKKSSSFAKKLGFYSIDGFNYAISVKNLLSYFQDRR